MTLRCFSSLSRRAWLTCGLALAAVAALAHPARAQVTMNADAGLERQYKSQRWLPVQVTLTNAGKPARVEVRARFGGEAPQEYRIPERTLQSNANEVHTLCLHAPYHYSAQPVTVDLYSDGRLINTVHANTALVTDGDWLVLGVGAGDTLKLLTNATLGAQQQAPNARSWGGNNGNKPHINVALLEARAIPDRWQAFDAADLMVLGNVSERDFTPEQQGALRDWVNAGGTLVVTGGANWNRLSTPFFQDLLPVRVTGSQTVSTLPQLSPNAPSLRGSAPFVVCTGAPKPEAEVSAQSGGAPMIASGPKGNGRVIFMAFDPSAPPFRDWNGTSALWKDTLVNSRRPQIIPALQVADGAEGDISQRYQQLQNAGMNTGGRLADAPYAIPQLDIPSFYLVALFLLAYIVVLVPVNYFFLKAKDKKEYAWLTTPAIVAVFSLGAYGIGYGFKGGRTLMVKVGVVEARAGQDSAPSLVYSGLFSPRKAGYDLKPVAANNTQADPAVLLSDPNASRSAMSLRVVQDDTQRLEDFSVDMWAMRIIKAEGVVRLNKGVTATLNSAGGSVTNNTGYTLKDCQVRDGARSAILAELRPGATASFKLAAPSSNAAANAGYPGASSPDAQPPLTGGREEKRMKQSVLSSLNGYVSGVGLSGARGADPMLLGWVDEPVSPILVDGGAPRELRATLMIVHLGKG